MSCQLQQGCVCHGKSSLDKSITLIAPLDKLEENKRNKHSTASNQSKRNRHNFARDGVDLEMLATFRSNSRLDFGLDEISNDARKSRDDVVEIALEIVDHVQEAVDAAGEEDKVHGRRASDQENGAKNEVLAAEVGCEL